MTQDELFKIGLLEMAADLHASQTGISDQLPDAVEAEYIRYLKLRLREWKDAPAPTQSYDGAVRHLLACALYERGITP